MNRMASVFAIFIVLGFGFSAHRDGTPVPDVPIASPTPSPTIACAQVPLYFVANQGQYAPEALFSAAPPGYTLWMTKNGLVFDSSRKAENGESEGARSVSRLTFLGSSAGARVEAVEPDSCRVNYFRGSDPSGWVSDIPTSRAVLYSDLYPETDLKVYGTAGAIEYDWVVRPGGDPGLIRFRYEASGGARLSAEGDLVVSTSFGDLIHHKPVCYQEISCERLSVAAAFKSLGDGVFGFEVGAYDPDFPLVIDPVVLVSSTFIGGQKYDVVGSVAVDPRGVVYALGKTESSDFPAVKGYDSKIAGDSDVFVLKFAADGRTLLFATFFGGSGSESGVELALDRKRTIWIAGNTSSTDLPTKNAVDPSANGDDDVFLARFNALGNTLLFSTYLGGGKRDVANGLALGTDYSVAVAGFTYSADFPVQTPFQAAMSDGPDAFVTKYAPGAKSIAFSTFLGGRGIDNARDVAMGGDGAIYLTGYTDSSDFPVKNAYSSKRKGGPDGIASKFDAKGALVYSTYFGGRDTDEPDAILVDAKGAAYITGDTHSKDFPVKNAYDATANGGEDVIFLKLAPSGQSLEFSTYIGASKYEEGTALALDASGAVWIAGMTESPQFPLKDAVDSKFGGRLEGFLARMSKAGSKLEFSTFLGGKRYDNVYALAVTAGGIVVVGGSTDSTDFPVLNPYAAELKGEYDGFIAKYKSSTTATKKQIQ